MGGGIREANSAEETSERKLKERKSRARGREKSGKLIVRGVYNFLFFFFFTCPCQSMHLSFKKTDFMNLFHKRVVLTTTSWELGLLSTLTRHRNKNPMQSLAANSSANVKVVNTKYKCVPLRHKLNAN